MKQDELRSLIASGIPRSYALESWFGAWKAFFVGLAFGDGKHYTDLIND